MRMLDIISPKDWLLGAYVTTPCDDFYTGCTQRYKDIHGPAWKHSGVVGYVGDGVFNENFPAWQPAVWNSACVTVVPAQGSLTVVLNGRRVLEEIYPAFSLVHLTHCWALIGRELHSVEIFSTQDSFCAWKPAIFMQ